jgi:hypothetical protein
MSTRPTLLDKAIKALDDKITALALAREELVNHRSAADLAVAKRPSLKTVSSK